MGSYSDGSKVTPLAKVDNLYKIITSKIFLQYNYKVER